MQWVWVSNIFPNTIASEAAAFAVEAELQQQQQQHGVQKVGVQGWGRLQASMLCLEMLVDTPRPQQQQEQQHGGSSMMSP
jgi:hypothetical protein